VTSRKTKEWVGTTTLKGPPERCIEGGRGKKKLEPINIAEGKGVAPVKIEEDQKAFGHPRWGQTLDRSGPDKKTEKCKPHNAMGACVRTGLKIKTAGGGREKKEKTVAAGVETKRDMKQTPGKTGNEKKHA